MEDLFEDSDIWKWRENKERGIEFLTLLYLVQGLNHDLEMDGMRLIVYWKSIIRRSMTESTSDQRRDRKCELGYLQKADGSCMYSLGGTVVLASVNGPGDLRSTKQLSDRALIEVYFHARIGGAVSASNSSTAEQRNVERILKSVCESCILTKQFPRSTVVITVQELHDDGSLVAAAAINSACLALLDAGIPLRTVFAAVTCVLTSNEMIVVEPDSKMEEIKAKMVFVFESHGEALTSCSVEGMISQDQLKMARENAKKVAEDVFKLYRTVVEKKFSKRMEFVDRKGVTMVEK